MLTESSPPAFGWKALLPFASFLALYLGMGVWLSWEGHSNAFYQFPAATSALFGFAVALLLGRHRVQEQIATFTRGIGQETVILMCLIFMLAGAFSTVTTAMGSVQASVAAGLALCPAVLLLPGIFLVACFASLAMGTSMGTIGTMVPIALGVATSSEISSALTVGAVVGGAMFGDNLSMISDTTIAATQTLGCSMRSKMRQNLSYALPAALGVCIALFFAATPVALPPQDSIAWIKTVPYLLVLALALAGVHVIITLLLGIFSAALIGLLGGDFSFLQLGQAIYQGFESMAEVFFLTVLTAGLAAIAAREGGLDFLLRHLSRLVTSKRGAELGVAALVSTADICVANNTVAILVTGPMAKKMADRFHVSAARMASVLDIFSCVWQGLIPYGAQMLLAGALTQLSPFEIIPYTWYPMALGVVTLGSILVQTPAGRGTQRRRP
jgi:Na+/H+ antiporter NhaC